MTSIPQKPLDQVHFSGSKKNISTELKSLIGELKEKYKAYKGKNVLLFYSGGLDTSFLTRIFAHEIGANVYTVSFDVGEDPRELGKIEERAKELGAKKHIHFDVKEEFVNNYCAKAIQSNALYQDAHPISSSMSRPLMIEKGIELAEKYDCNALIHGSSPWQNNAYRFNNALFALSQNLQPLAPVMDDDIPRELENEYLQHYGMTIRKGEDQLYSADYNLWAPEVEDGILAQIDVEPPESLFKLGNYTFMTS